MRKLAAAIAIILFIVAGLFLVAEILSRRAQSMAAEAFAKIETPAAFAARYPKVTRKNDSARELERLALPLGIELEAVAERKGTALAFDDHVAAALGRWLDEQRASTDDTITPPPPELEQWLAAHEAPLAAVVAHLRTQPAPQWPDQLTRVEVDPDRPYREPSIPNLLGQMRLMKVLSAAALRAELAGNHARAWEIQEAQWKQARALYDRRELISRLVSIAGLRLVASNARKFEPPVPAWFVSLDALRIRAGVLDSVRHEFLDMDDATALMRDRQSRRGRAEAVTAWLTEPLQTWTYADVLAATAKELHRVSSADPCAMDLEHTPQRIRADLSPISKVIADIRMPNLIESMVRAASTEIALEGSLRVLEAKRALAAGLAVPAASPSACRNAQWVYATRAGVESIRFAAPAPGLPQPRLARMPLHFVLRSTR